jgi:hypothetical protein
LRRGLEGAATLRPGVDGLTVRASIAGVLVDALSSSSSSSSAVALIEAAAIVAGAEAPVAGTVQPAAALQARWAPAGPVALWARVSGALPQTRLSTEEQLDRALCPELPTSPDVPQARPCAGAPGFALVDVGATLALGQLRFDLTGENALDAEARWRGATLGVGGTSVRLRAAFVF